MAQMLVQSSLIATGHPLAIVEVGAIAAQVLGPLLSLLLAVVQASGVSMAGRRCGHHGQGNHDKELGEHGFAGINVVINQKLNRASYW
jgi:hypothetical protein